MPKKSHAARLDEHLGYWLRFVSNHVSHAFRLKVETLGVTVAEWVVLRALFDEESLNPATLAERLGMTRGAISKLGDRLLVKRLIACRREKDDRRFQSLSLSAAGRKLVPKLAALADRNEEEFFGHLRADQRASLAAVLREIVQRRELRGVPVD